jgi:methyl-accepting chemotaxis protein
MGISQTFPDSGATLLPAGSLVTDSSRQADNEYARISSLLGALSGEVGASMEEIHKINSMLRMIAFNSRIEAAKAGEAGKAFAIVSGEMRALSEQTAQVARKLREDTGKVIGEVQQLITDLATQVRGTRMSDLALTNIDLIDRNLYERSCDVRWWAIDSSLVDALQAL